MQQSYKIIFYLFKPTQLTEIKKKILRSAEIIVTTDATIPQRLYCIVILYHEFVGHTRRAANCAMHATLPNID